VRPEPSAPTCTAPISERRHREIGREREDDLRDVAAAKRAAACTKRYCNKKGSLSRGDRNKWHAVRFDGRHFFRKEFKMANLTELPATTTLRPQPAETGYRTKSAQSVDSSSPAPFSKIFPFPRDPNQIYIPRVLPHRGAYRDRHGRGVGCGGRGSLGRALAIAGRVEPCERFAAC
jgi:hypothetical protein